MSLMYIKLRNGEDLIGYVESLNNAYRITSPISIEVDPTMGFFAKNWLIFSADNSTVLQKEDVFICTEASEKAIHYYEEFLHQYNQPSSEEGFSDIEEMLVSMIESKSSIKH